MKNKLDFSISFSFLTYLFLPTYKLLKNISSVPKWQTIHNMRKTLEH